MEEPMQLDQTATNPFKQEKKEISSIALIKNNEDLRNLWIACFFDRKVTKAFVQQINLPQTIIKLKRFLRTYKIDLKLLSSLLTGLTKLYSKKLDVLMKDSN